MLTYCISYIGFGKNLLVDITKRFLGARQYIMFSTVWKMLKYGLSLTVFSCIWTEFEMKFTGILFDVSEGLLTVKTT